MKSNKIKVVFVGQTYAKKSLKVFLKLISNINISDLTHIELHYFGNSIQDILDFCESENLSKNAIFNHGYVESSKIIEKIKKYDAAFLPYFSNENFKVSIESFPSKFAVYISAGLPIFYVGNIKNEVSQLIERNKIGITLDNDKEIDWIKYESFLKILGDSEVKKKIYEIYKKLFSSASFLKTLSNIFDNNFESSLPINLVDSKYKINDRLKYQDVKNVKYLSDKISVFANNSFPNSSNGSANNNTILQIIDNENNYLKFKFYTLFNRNLKLDKEFKFEYNKSKIVATLQEYFENMKLDYLLILGFEELNLQKLSKNDNLNKVISHFRHSRIKVISKTPLYNSRNTSLRLIPFELTNFDDYGLTFIIRALLSKLSFTCTSFELLSIFQALEFDENFKLNLLKRISNLEYHFHDPQINSNQNDYYNHKKIENLSRKQKINYINFVVDFFDKNVDKSDQDLTLFMKIGVFMDILELEVSDIAALFEKSALNRFKKDEIVQFLLHKYSNSQLDLNHLLNSKKLKVLNFFARMIK